MTQSPNEEHAQGPVGQDKASASSEAEAPEPATPPAKQLVFRGSAWVFAGYGVGQVLRLGSNIIAARLLVPEHFGVMVLVNVAIQGLKMVSDLGLGPGIIQNPKGDDPSCVRTAWTMQIARGLVLWLTASLFAWPYAYFYEEPRFLLFLPVAASTVFLGSFSTASLFLQNRRLKIGLLTALELISQVVGLAAMIYWAWRAPYIWALIAGSIVSTTTRMALSHLLVPEPRMRFEFHPKFARELIRFGKWIFLATLLTFLVDRVDRLVMGKLMTKEELGVYFVAVMFASVMLEVTRRISSQVLFPFYSATARTKPDEIRKHAYRLRMGLLPLTLAPTWFLILFGPEIIEFLYDDRYLGAGWMMQILGVGVLLNTIIVPTGSILLARGDSARHLLNLVARSVTLLPALCLGGVLYGVRGIFVAMAVAPVLHYPFMVMLVRRYKVWFPSLDFAAALISAIVVGCGLWLKG